MAVAAVDATVRGQAEDTLLAETHDPGLLTSGEPTAALITFTNTSDRDISLAEWPYVAEVASSSEGHDRLGITGVGGPMTCYRVTMVIEPGVHEVATVILNVDEDGRC